MSDPTSNSTNLGTGQLEKERATLTQDLNSDQSRSTLKLEQTKSKAARILEVVKTTDPDTAAENLKFLVETGLIADSNTRDQIPAYLNKRQPGQGVSLPSAQTTDIDRDAAATALFRLGERESGTARLEEAVATYRAALQDRPRARVPLDWALTQNNLGDALLTLGKRESGTARLEEAVAAYREALKERTRERVPPDWAATQNNLGTALQTLGERQSGTAHLKEAVAAYRAALEERTRARVPLDWSQTQNNLGTALSTLGERESGTAHLEEAVAAYRAAQEEWTRERVPPDWAATQDNLGTALQTLGARQSGTAHLEELAVAFVAREKSEAEQYAVILATVGKADTGRYVRGIQLYADAKAEFDGLIAELKVDLATEQDSARSAVFTGALQGAAE
jgi:tetratricopeptide (TPR) repeat protein